MFSIVICTMGCINYLKQTFDIILKNKDITQIIIVDNTHDESTSIFLNKIKSKKLVIVRNGTNQGVIKSRNQGIALATEEYTLVLDDDQVPVKGDQTFDRYKALVDTYDIIGCEAQIMDFETGLTRLGNVTKFTYVGAGGMCMKTSLWRELGLFDEVFHPAYFEDPDICLRAKQKGYSIGLVQDHGIHHYAHKTLFRSDLGFNHETVMLRNRKVFLGRYGLVKRVDTEDSVHTKKRILHILSNVGTGGVQQNVALISKGLSSEAVMAVYVAESGEQGEEFERYVGNIQVFYNKQVTLINNNKVYRNVSHRSQHVTNKAGVSKVIKPGGLLQDVGYELHLVPSFRLDSLTSSTEGVGITSIIESFKPDIVHYHRDISRISRDVSKLRTTVARFNRVKVVRSVHGSSLPNLNNYDKAILLTKTAMNGAMKRYPKVKVTHIPNGIDIKLFCPLKLRKEHICITHTRLSKILKLTSDPSIYFKVISKVCALDNNVKFVLIGPDYDIYKERFNKFISIYNLGNKLLIKPPMYDSELVSYINKAKVWFYPMKEDNFPLAVIEAMACSLPVVATNLVGISEMITNDEEGLLSAPTDVNMFVTNIIRCLRDTHLSERLGLNARKRAVAHYSLDVMLQRYSDMYSGLIRG